MAALLQSNTYHLAEVSMTPEQFEEAVRKLRSPDSMTYEDGYQWLRGDNLKRYLQQIVKLLRAETDPEMRGRFVELVGNADLPDNIPLLVEEMAHESRDVRFWAYNQLSLSEHESARLHAEQYRKTHPTEDFY